MPRFLEDYEIGQIERFGLYEVTREEVLRFASAYDPQPFHLDDDAAAANPIFGRLAASGWHTASMVMRMLVDHRRSTGEAMLASPGIDELRWLRPVYPGETLRVEREILGVRPSGSRPDIGSVKTRLSAFNQHDDEVMRMIAIELVERRPE